MSYYTTVLSYSPFWFSVTTNTETRIVNAHKHVS